MENEQADLLGDLIDAAVEYQPKARLLLQENPNLLHAHCHLGETALHFLAVEGFAEGVRFLASVGADVNAKNKYGDTPIIDAATLGEEDIVRILLSFGADPNAESTTKVNALHCGISSGLPGVVEALLEAGANPNYRTDLDETPFSDLPTDAQEREAILAVFRKFAVKETK